MDIAEIAGTKGQKQVFYTIYILYPAPDSSFIKFTFYILLPILLFYNLHFLSCFRFFFYTIYILYPTPDSSFINFKGTLKTVETKSDSFPLVLTVHWKLNMSLLYSVQQTHFTY